MYTYICILKKPYSTDTSVERGVYIWRGIHLYSERAIFDRYISRKSSYVNASLDMYISFHIHMSLSINIYLSNVALIYWKSHIRQMYLTKAAYSYEKMWTYTLKEPYPTDISVEEGMCIWKDIHLYIERGILDRYICRERHLHMKRCTHIYSKNHIRQIYISNKTYKYAKRYICQERHFRGVNGKSHIWQIYLSKEAYTSEKRHIYVKRGVYIWRGVHVYITRGTFDRYIFIERDIWT